MLRKLSAVVIVVAMALVALTTLPGQAQAQEAPFGPWVDEIVFSQNSDTSIVLSRIIAGDEDVLLFTVLGVSNLLRAQAAPEIWTIETFGSYSGFVMNPIPQQTGFNPFTIKEVREGVQWLVDRELIAREIYAGFAVPFYGPFHPKQADYGRFIDEIVLIEDKYANNPAKAREQITAALTAAGASLDTNGKWRDPDNNLIEIVIWMRIEDERLQEGQYLASLLDGLGFTVSPTPVDRTFISKVYGGAADQGLWHVYTEGFISTAQINVDDFQLDDFYACYWEKWCLESGQENGYKPPQDLFDVYEALAFREYADYTEREQWIRDALPRALPEAYRAWTVAQQSLYPVNNRVSAGYDLFGGPVHEMFARTAKLESDPDGIRADGSGGSLRLVNLLAGQDAWNPYIVIGTLYDSDIRDTANDFAMLRHPYTGNLIDMRATTVSVETEGPDGVLDVPATAQIFNPGNATNPVNQWVAVGSGVNATSKVTFDLALGKWHHGQDITMTDVKHDIAMNWRRALGDLSIQPNAIDSASKAFLPKYKGFEFVDADTYVVYLDTFNLDPQEIAGAAVFWPEAPWELHEVMGGTMLDGDLAADEKDSDSLAIPWMDQTKGASIPILQSKMGDLKTANHKAVGLEASISDAEATARWAALDTWFTARGHFFVSSGPFWLENFNTATWSFTMKAFRDGYPFRADKWEDFRFPKIPDVALRAPATVFSGTPAVFDFTSTVAGTPYDRIESTWFLKDLSTGQIVERGSGVRVGAGAYQVTLSSALTEQLLLGNFQLILVVASEDAAVPTIQKASFLILPSTAWFQGLLSATESALRGDIDTLESQQGNLARSLDEATAATQGLVFLVITLAVLAVVSIVIAVVSVILVLRRVKAG